MRLDQRTGVLRTGEQKAEELVQEIEAAEETRREVALEDAYRIEELKITF